MSTDLTALEDRIASRIDMASAQGLPISVQAGGMTFSNMSQVFEFSKMMAIGGIAVRKHLRGNPGACLAVTIQAIEWRMSPFAVANKSYSVNDQLAYEAQLIHAVILMRAPLLGRPMFKFEGEGGNRKCIVWGTLDDGTGQVVEYTSPVFDKITPKNSPLWKADPDQQHCYYSVRAFARRHFPDIILGVYASDEIQTENPRDVTPSRPTIEQALDQLAGPADVSEARVVEAPAVDQEKPKRERRKRDASPVNEAAPAAEAAKPEPAKPEPTEPRMEDDGDDDGAPADAGEASAPENDDYDDGFADEEPASGDEDSEDERIFIRMEGLDVAPRGIDQKDVDQCRYFLQGHDAAHAKHPRTVPADLRKRYVEGQDERARLLCSCWMRGHDAVTGFVPPKKS